MVVLDASIVNIAIPSAKKALNISNANQQWVVTAYTLAFGSLLLVGGRIGDFIGRKKVYIIGLLGFAGASAIGGIAQTQGQLFAARALQGVFGALLAPAVLSIISVTFTDPKERAKAFSSIGAIAGGGAAIGLILGGTLTEYFSWRWCLGVNVPIALIVGASAAKWLHDSHAEGEHGYDFPGVVTATSGLFALVYGFSRAASHGWGNSTTLTFFAIAAVLLIAFVLIEKSAKYPLMPLHVITERNRGRLVGRPSHFLAGLVHSKRHNTSRDCAVVVSDSDDGICCTLDVADITGDDSRGRRHGKPAGQANSTIGRRTRAI